MALSSLRILFYFLLLLFGAWNPLASSAQSLVRAEYFIDQDPGTGKGTPLSYSLPSDSIQGVFAISVDTFSVGTHFVYARFLDSGGLWTPWQMHLFYIEDTVNAAEISNVEYFLNQDPGTAQGTRTNIRPANQFDTFFTASLDTFSAGRHFLHVRSKIRNGFWSPWQLHVLYLEDTVNVGLIDGMEYFIDQEPGPGNGTDVAFQRGNTFDTAFQVSLDTFNAGRHYLHVRNKISNGFWSPWQLHMLYLEDTLNAGPIAQVEYFLNQEPGTGKGASAGIQKDQNFDTVFSVASDTFSPGQHFLHIRTLVEDGLWSPWQLHMLYLEANDTSGKSKISRIEYAIDSSLLNAAYTDTFFLNPPADTFNIELQVRTDTSLSFGNHLFRGIAKQDNGISSSWHADTFTIIDCPMLNEAGFNILGSPCRGDTILLTENITPLGIWPADSFRFSWTLNGQSAGSNDSVFVRLSADSLQINFTFTRISDGRCNGNTSRIIRVFQSYRDTLRKAICAGDSTLIHGKFEKNNGTFVYQGSSQQACDSISVVILEVKPTYNDSVFLSICPGDSILIHGIYRKTAGTYVLNDTTSQGCDSSVSIRLELNPIFSKNDTFAICDGDTLRIHGKSYPTAGTYRDSFQTINGCDSTFQTLIIVHPVVHDTLKRSICQGDSLLIHGNFEKSSGNYFFSGTTSKGCDSTVLVQLEVLPVYNDSFTLSICQGDSALIHGIARSQSGVYVLNGNTLRGCDSTVTVRLIINPVFSKRDTFERCSGDTLRVHGKKYFSTGLFTDTLTTVLGCDSNFLTQLIVRPVYNQVFTIGLCGGDSFFFDGQQRNQSGMYDAMFQTIHGCDSFVRIDLKVDSLILTDEFPSICLGDSMFIGGAYRKTAGTYTDIYQARGGCDSLVNRHLSIIPHDSSYIADTICSRRVFNFQGQILSAAGLYQSILKNQRGCDSFVFLNLFVRPDEITTLNGTICFGDSTFVGNSYKKGRGFFSDTMSNRFGCDSIVQYTQTERPFNDTTLNENLCRGDSLFTGNRFKFSGGLFTDTLTDQFGCDSAVNTLITLLEPSISRLNDTICFQDVVNFFGRNLNKPGIYSHRLINAVGCDSVVELNLFRRAQFIPRVLSFGFDSLGADTLYASYIWFRNREIIAGENNRFIRVTLRGTYDVSVTNAFGCSANSWDDLLSSPEAIFSDKFVLYPNPADQVLNLIAPRNAYISLYNSNGILMDKFEASAGDHRINTQAFASGMYFLMIQDANHISHHKFIIVH